MILIKTLKYFAKRELLRTEICAVVLSLRVHNETACKSVKKPFNFIADMDSVMRFGFNAMFPMTIVCKKYGEDVWE